MNYSFGLLKPDCLKRGLEKKILAEIETIGLRIIAVKRVRLTKKEVDAIWSSCIRENFYEEFLKFSTSGDCIVFIAKGDDAIVKLSNFVGHWDPKRAKKHTIRHRYGTSAMENVIHSSATKEAFWKEVSLFFTKAELSRLLTDLEPKEGVLKDWAPVFFIYLISGLFWF